MRSTLDNSTILATSAWPGIVGASYPIVPLEAWHRHGTDTFRRERAALAVGGQIGIRFPVDAVLSSMQGHEPSEVAQALEHGVESGILLEDLDPELPIFSRLLFSDELAPAYFSEEARLGHPYQRTARYIGPAIVGYLERAVAAYASAGPTDLRRRRLRWQVLVEVAARLPGLSIEERLARAGLTAAGFVHADLHTRAELADTIVAATSSGTLAECTALLFAATHFDPQLHSQLADEVGLLIERIVKSLPGCQAAVDAARRPRYSALMSSAALELIAEASHDSGAIEAWVTRVCNERRACDVPQVVGDFLDRSIRAVLYVGRQLEFQEGFDEAMRFLARYLRPNWPQVASHFGALGLALGEYEYVVEGLSFLAATDSQVAFPLARALVALGRGDEAIEALRRHPNEFQCSKVLADLYLDRGELEEARQVLRPLRTFSSQAAQRLQVLESASTVEEALKIISGTAAQSVDAAPPADIRAADDLLAAGLIEQSIALLVETDTNDGQLRAARIARRAFGPEAAIELLESSPISNERSALALAHDYEEVGRVDEALRVLEPWHTTSPGAASRFASLLEKEGEADEARQVLARFVGTHEASALAMVQLLDRQGKHDEAMEVEEALQGRFPVLGLNLARRHISRKDLDGARLTLDRLVQSGRAELAASTAKILVLIGQPEEAILLLRRHAMAVSSAAVALARILSQSGKKQEAEWTLRNALAISRGSDVQRTLATMLAGEGRLEEARLLLSDRAADDQQCALELGRILIQNGAIKELERMMGSGRLERNAAATLAKEISALVSTRSRLRNSSGAPEQNYLSGAARSRDRDANNILFKEADEMWIAGRFDEAETMLRACRDDVKVIAGHAEMLALLGEPERAVQSLVSRVSDLPSLASTLSELCHIYNVWEVGRSTLVELSRQHFGVVFLLLLDDPSQLELLTGRLTATRPPPGRWALTLAKDIKSAVEGNRRAAIRAADGCIRSGYQVVAEDLLLRPIVNDCPDALVMYSTLLRKRFALDDAISCLGDPPNATAETALAAAISVYLDGRGRYADNLIATCPLPAVYFGELTGHMAESIERPDVAVRISRHLEVAGQLTAAYDLVFPHRHLDAPAVDKQLDRLSEALRPRQKMAIARLRQRWRLTSAWRIGHSTDAELRDVLSRRIQYLSSDSPKRSNPEADNVQTRAEPDMAERTSVGSAEEGVGTLQGGVIGGLTIVGAEAAKAPRSILARAIVEAVRDLVNEADEPLRLSAVGHIVASEFGMGGSAKGWAGAGSLSTLLRSARDPNLEVLADEGGYIVFNPNRHSARPRSAEALVQSPDAPMGAIDMFRLREGILGLVRGAVEGSTSPVPLARLGHIVIGQFGEQCKASNWAGTGSLKALIKGASDSNLQVMEGAPGMVCDPRIRDTTSQTNVQGTARRESAESVRPVDVSVDTTGIAGLRGDILQVVRDTVQASRRPVLLSRLGQVVIGQCGKQAKGSRWAGTGSLKALIEGACDPTLQVSTNAPWRVYDPNWGKSTM